MWGPLDTIGRLLFDLLNLHTYVEFDLAKWILWLLWPVLVRLNNVYYFIIIIHD